MSITPQSPWSRTAQLLERSCRDKAVRNIGIEIERIGMWENGDSLHYQPGKEGRPGAGQILVQLGEKLGWPLATYSEASPLGLTGPAGKVSLEPGSQLEFSANPMPSVQTTTKAVLAFEEEVDLLPSTKGLRWIGLGMNPFARVEEMDVIPLTRYRLMTDYLAKQGTLGTSMMRLTSSIQLNYDYSSEAEAISMLRAGLALAPLSTALFGNSPFAEGRPNGWLSMRSEIWRNTDPERTGLMPEAFEKGFNFLRYAELAWKRPLMFVQARDEKNVASHRRSLQEIALGQLDSCVLNEENELNALRQVFTEARLKPGYVEIRSIDGLRVADRGPCIAFWTGIMYSEAARNLAIDRLGGLTPKLHNQLWVAASRDGLRAQIGNLSLQTLAEEMLQASKKGLIQRGLGEEVFLSPIDRNVRDSKNPADRILDLYSGPWKRDLSQVIRYSADRSA